MNRKIVKLFLDKEKERETATVAEREKTWLQFVDIINNRKKEKNGNNRIKNRKLG